MLDAGPSVLVLYENFAVGTAIQRRLLDVPMVHMVRGESVSACQGSYDVVVVCPYLREHRRAEALRRWAGQAIIELRDLGGATGAVMLSGDPADTAADAVLGALSPW